MDGRRGWWVGLGLVMGLVWWVGVVAANVIEAPDGGNVVLNTSLALDGDGYPVVAYYDDTAGVLKVMHCNDAACAGSDESIEVVDDAGNVGQEVSMVLDGDGFPVASYYDRTNQDLKVLHCNDANCAGGDESIEVVDAGGNVGLYSALALDGDGFPVVAYFDGTNGDLKVMHCNDANCAGGDESIETVDDAGVVGLSPSLALDGDGYPVVSYYEQVGGTEGHLKVLHCNDADCAGGDESMTSPDSTGDVGIFNDLALDAEGFPVIAYYDRVQDEGTLNVMHCNDADCAGDDESIVVVDDSGQAGWDVSLVLDGDGYPVVSYYDAQAYDLVVLRCNDADCAGGDEAIKRPDVQGDVGIFTSLALDGTGNPVVSYGYFEEDDDEEYGELRVLTCDNALCNTGPVADAGADMVGVAGEAVNFAGSATDQDGDVLEVVWDFGDGETAVGMLTPAHVYGAAGVYTATLTVDDGDGGVATDAVVVTVEEAEVWVYLPVIRN